MSNFSAEQGRTRVCDEAYFSYVEKANQRRTQLGGKRAISGWKLTRLYDVRRDSSYLKATRMAKGTKLIVSFEESFGKLDIRVGRVVDVKLETRTHKPTYKMIVDFGKFGKRVSYGRFTQHPAEEVKERLVLGVLNFKPRQMGPVVSEVLILGVQYPKAESGEATFVSPSINAKIGSKLF